MAKRYENREGVGKPPDGQLYCRECEEFHDIDAFAKNPNQPHRAGGREYFCKESQNTKLRIGRLMAKSSDQLIDEVVALLAKVKEYAYVLKSEHGIDLEE